MTFCLYSIFIKPENGVEIKNAIILLHGYGGDGKDISMLSLNWKRHMPNTVFICPNGHEPCAINPSGYQWFDLTKVNKFFIDLNIKNFEPYFAPPTTLAKMFTLRGVPTTILINKEGQEFARIMGSINFEDKNFINWIKKYN